MMLPLNAPRHGGGGGGGGGGRTSLFKMSIGMMFHLVFAFSAMAKTRGENFALNTKNHLSVPTPLSSSTASAADDTPTNLAASSTIASFVPRRRLEEKAAAEVFKKRTQINDIYSDPFLKKYGPETRTVIRYQHPDGLQRNLCAMADESFMDDYYMYNYKLTPPDNAYIEVKYTDELDLIHNTTEGDDYEFQVYCKRPKAKDGYERLGDVIFLQGEDKKEAKKALLVKAAGDVLAMPKEYKQVLSESITADGDKKEVSLAPTLWQPVCPAGYVCLGHIWTLSKDMPETDLIRCVKKEFVESTSPGKKTQNEAGTIWHVAASGTTLASDTFVARACRDCSEPKEEFHALKKKCIPGYGDYPFCKGKTEMSTLQVVGLKKFQIPYARLQSCALAEEDKTIYGLSNEDSRWERFAVELYKAPAEEGEDESASFVGYRMRGVSDKLGKHYCLGSTAFGSSKFKNDLFMHEIPPPEELLLESANSSSTTNHGYCYDPVRGGCLCRMSDDKPCTKTALAFGGAGSAGDPCLSTEDEFSCSNNGLGCRFEAADYFEKNCEAPPCYTTETSAPPPEGGLISDFMAEKLRRGELGKWMSSKTKGDFVFLWPCSEDDELNQYRSELKTMAREANSDGFTENGVVNAKDDLGKAADFGETEKWSNPHFCGQGEEPSVSGVCEVVDGCSYEKDGCIVYDEQPCDLDEECGSGTCGEDGLCGEKLKLHGEKKDSFQVLPRSIPYGVEQDGGTGRTGFLTDKTGETISLFGNTWKAFKMESKTVSRYTVLEFDFQLNEEAEGHAICLDEDLNEDVEIKGANRCFRLAGEQKALWSEVWQSPGPDPLKALNKFQHFKIEIGSLEKGPAVNQPFISWGSSVNYLALIQDNDANGPVGASKFKNIKLYDTATEGGADSTKQAICNRRNSVNSLWGSSRPSQLGSTSRSIARYPSNNLCVKATGYENYNYRMENYEISVSNYLEVKWSNQYDWIYNDKGTGANWDFSTWRVRLQSGWYRLGDVGNRSHKKPSQSTILVKGGGNILRKPTGYTRIWRDKGSGGKYDGSCWKPNPPWGYKCLGHVWRRDYSTPSTNDVRCIKNEYLMSNSGSYQIWKDKGSGADKDVSVWKVSPGSSGLSTGTIITKGSYSSPSTSDLYVIKKSCTKTYGSFPFCSQMSLKNTYRKDFSVPYGRLVPCGFPEEDKTAYGLKNSGTSYKQYSVELYNDGRGFIGYKHLEVSRIKGKPYCLGTRVFGSSKVSGSSNIKYTYKTGTISATERSNQEQGKYYRQLNQQISGDFVFFFPCSNNNDIGSYYNSLVSWRNSRKSSTRLTGVVAGSGNDLGRAASAGHSYWRTPHRCLCGNEPTNSGGCKAVADGCYYNPSACPADSTCATDGSSCVCKDGYLSEIEGTTTLFSHTPGDSCLPSHLAVRQEIDGTSFTMNIDNKQNKRFKIELKREDARATDQAPLSVFAYDGKFVTSSGSTGTYEYKFEDLLAGNLYKAKALPVDGGGGTIAGAVVQTSEAIIQCCCDCDSSIQGDTSGRPVDFKASQERGRVMFSFQDNSRCAEAYAFTRSEVSGEFVDNSDERFKAVFTPNYYYYPKERCGRAPVLPGTSAADDLMTSHLKVGVPYRYCVRAVAQHYSSNSPRSSDEACMIHHIRWQASLDGEITSAPNAGGIPIEGVTVFWELLNGDQSIVITSGNFMTGKPGKFVMEFDELHESLDRDTEMPVRVKFFKSTVVGDQVIPHEFACEKGPTAYVDCTVDGTIVYLKHLTFDKPLVAYDMTAVPVRGRVTILEEDGCPVIGAEVCLMLKQVEGEDKEGPCVKTDHNGDYSLAASLGSTVGVSVSYNNHTFVKAPNNAFDYDEGIFVDPNRRYERNDFVDTQTATLQVEVAGGLCNKRLGKSEIEVKINGCDAWEMILSQQGFMAHHWVPAHVLDIRVTGVTSDEGKAHHRIQEEFAEKSMTKTIDLVDVGEAEEEKEETEVKSSQVTKTEEEEELEELVEEQETKIEIVRFQYDGTLQVNFLFLGADTAGDCTLDSVKPKGTVSDDPDTTSSLHVTPTGSSFTPLIALKYELLEDLYCDVVKEDEMSVRILNSVGIDDDFEAYAATIKDETMKTRLQLCSDDIGCSYKVKHDKVNGVLSNAHCLPTSDNGEDVIFMAGRPKIEGDYRKDFIAEVLDKDLQILKRHHAQVLVVGDYVTGAGASFSLPTYFPILMLRDPPGGLSQATYENVETTIKVKNSEYEKLWDVAVRGAIGASVDNAHLLCKGAIVVYECSDILKYDIGGEIGGGYARAEEMEHDVDAYTTAYTTTWSYTTSDDPLRAGRNSDIIVTPNLHVNFHNVENINFEPKKCSADKKTTVKFDLKDPGNQPALSFYTIYNIETLQIPELKTAIANKEREIEEEEDKTAKEAATVQLETLQDALKGWNQIIDKHNDTNTLASDGKLEIAAREWFDKWAATKLESGSLPSIAKGDHHSNLAPESLTERAEPFDFEYIKQAELEASDKQDIKQTNLIQFSGGGGTVEFVLDHVGAHERERMDSSEDNKEEYGFGDLSAYLKFAAFGAEFEITAEGEAGGQTIDSNSVANEKENATSISFVLGDEQKDDEFAVEVYIDPKYGTFVFHTVSGISSQPHEPGTQKGEDIRLEIERPTRPVMPDEPLVFHLEIANYAPPTNYFNLFLDHTTNKGGLIHRLGGDGLAIAPEFGPFRGEASFTLEVFRGPQGYMFEPSVMQLSGVWDEDAMEAKVVQIYNYVDEKDGKWIRFEEPCPTIEWVGVLKREKKFIVDKQSKPVPLTIFNPRKQDGSLESIAKGGRLDHVHVWYRELGEPEWKKAQLEDLSQIDFANIVQDDHKEDKYGFATIPWDLAKRLTLNDDGSYEVMVESTCKEVPGAPADFNAFSTEPVLVIVDRIEPEMYGKALPIRENVIPGEEVAMIFTEDIDCNIPYRFDLEVRLKGLDDLFDARNLKIYCKERKLAFQFDPTRIDYALLMGKEMTVIVDKVADLQGNEIKKKIAFTKLVASLSGDEIAAEFDIKLEPTTHPSCMIPQIKDLEDIQQPISKLLGLDNPYRVQVKSKVCEGSKIEAGVEILPAARRRGLRAGSNQEGSAEEEEEPTAMEAFYTLLNSGQRSRKLVGMPRNSSLHTNLAVEVDNLHIIPGTADMKRYSLNMEPSPEEEMILAVGDGCDKHNAQQREHLLRVEQRVAARLNQTELHMEKDIEILDEKIDQTEHHLTTVDHKLDDVLALLGSRQGHNKETSIGVSSHESEVKELLEELRTERKRGQYQMMSSAFVLLASWSILLAVLYNKGRAA